MVDLNEKSVSDVFRFEESRVKENVTTERKIAHKYITLLRDYTIEQFDLQFPPDRARELEEQLNMIHLPESEPPDPGIKCSHDFLNLLTFGNNFGHWASDSMKYFPPTEDSSRSRKIKDAGDIYSSPELAGAMRSRLQELKELASILEEMTEAQVETLCLVGGFMGTLSEILRRTEKLYRQAHNEESKDRFTRLDTPKVSPIGAGAKVTIDVTAQKEEVLKAIWHAEFESKLGEDNPFWPEESSDFPTRKGFAEDIRRTKALLCKVHKVDWVKNARGRPRTKKKKRPPENDQE